MKAACLLYGSSIHYLDHLAPLASLLDIPVVTSEERIYELLEAFYPNVKRIYLDYIDIPFSLVKEFDLIIYSFTREHFQSIFAFAQDSLQKKLIPVWCPHGNSDKDNLDSLKEEEFLLIYGEKMRGILQEKKVNVPSEKIGAFRKTYYASHKPFYDALIQKELSSLPKENPSFLYAPTWKDYEDSSSFEEAFPHLLKKLPDSLNLIVKLHPNTWEKHSLAIDKMFFPYEHKKNLLLLPEFPPIHPLLERVDAYIGDMSSIGYDFLAFDKPMFFLSPKKAHPLLACGHAVDKNLYPEIYSFIEERKNEDSAFSEKRRLLYEHTFADIPIKKEELWKTIYGNRRHR